MYHLFESTDFEFEFLSNFGINLRYQSFAESTLPAAAPALLSLPHKEVTAAEGPLFANIDGTSGDDILNGTNSADTINGFDGDDELYGLGGDDVLSGGEGDDIINGGAGDDIVFDQRGRDDLDGGVGNDTLSYANLDEVQGVVANLRLDFVDFPIGVRTNIANFEEFIGSDSDDSIYWGVDFHTIDAGAGDDVVRHSHVPDTHGDFFDGGTGEDQFNISFYTVGVMPWIVDLTTEIFSYVGSSAPADTIVNFENIDGSQVHDILRGNAGDNIIFGHDGDDILHATAGDDVLNGIGDNDTIVFDTAFASQFLGSYGGGDGTDTVMFRGDGIIDLSSRFDTHVTEFEALVFDVDGNMGTRTVFLDGIDLRSSTGFSPTSTVAGRGNGVSDQIIVDASLSFDIDLSGWTFTNWNAADLIQIITSSFTDAVFTGTVQNDEFITSVSSSAFSRILDGHDGRDTLNYAASTAAIQVDLAANTAAGGFADVDTISNFESIEGSAYGDTLTSAIHSGIINGNDGDDMIFQAGGLQGAQLNGGNGNDTITSAVTKEGAELNGGAGDDILTVFNDSTLNAADTANGGAGDDIIVVGLTDILGLELDGGADVDTLDLFSLAQGFTVDIGAGTLVNNTTSDAAAQVINFENVRGGAADDDIFGDANANIIKGGGGDDFIIAGDGDDQLAGGIGNDDLYGGAGADALFGGDGTDRTFYNDSLIGLTVNTLNTALNTGIAIGDTYSSIESFFGSNFNDVITSGSDNNDLSGLAGDDTLVGAGGIDRLFGGAGADRLLGGLGNDFLFGGADADTFIIQVGAGVDRVQDYEDGLDVIQYIGGPGSFADLTIAQVGADTTITSVLGIVRLAGISAAVVDAGDFIFTNPQAAPTGVTVVTDLTANVDIFTGDENDDVVNGLAGNDTIKGGIGDDTLNGGDGNDLLTGGQGADILNGGAGVDRVLYSTASIGVTINAINTALNTGDATGDTYIDIENFAGSNGDDTITGDNNDNVIQGLGGADVISGAGGNDSLFGGLNDDRLLGGSGDDDLRGEAGNDTYAFRNNAGNDRIFGFEQGLDTIEFAQGPADINDLTITISGNDTIIDYEDGQITIKAFTDTLTAADFDFVNPSTAEAPADKKVDQDDAALETEDLPASVDDALLTEFNAEPAPYIYTGIDGVLDIITADEDGYWDLVV